MGSIIILNFPIQSMKVILRKIIMILGIVIAFVSLAVLKII